MSDMIPSLPRLRAPALPPDYVLSEILLCLPPDLASLLRATLVCKRWRRLLHDPRFLRRLRAFHRTPPVLGFYHISPLGPAFVPVGEPTSRVPRASFSFRDTTCASSAFRGGRALVRSRPDWLQLLVWNPVTGHRRCVHLGPLGSHVQDCNAAALGDQGACRREGSFRVAFVFTGKGRGVRLPLLVYSSETGAWGRLFTAEARCDDVDRKPSALVGDALYLMLKNDDILELQLGKESLAVLARPPGAQSLYEGNIQLIEAEGCLLGLAGVKEYNLQLWAREAGLDVNGRWVLRSTLVKLDRWVFRVSTRPGQTAQHSTAWLGMVHFGLATIRVVLGWFIG